MSAWGGSKNRETHHWNSHCGYTSTTSCPRLAPSLDRHPGSQHRDPCSCGEGREPLHTLRQSQTELYPPAHSWSLSQFSPVLHMETRNTHKHWCWGECFSLHLLSTLLKKAMLWGIQSCRPHIHVWLPCLVALMVLGIWLWSSLLDICSLLEFISEISDRSQKQHF